MEEISMAGEYLNFRLGAEESPPSRMSKHSAS